MKKKIVLPGGLNGAAVNLAGMSSNQKIKFLMARAQALEVELAKHQQLIAQLANANRETARLSHWVAALIDLVCTDEEDQQAVQDAAIENARVTIAAIRTSAGEGKRPESPSLRLLAPLPINDEETT